MIYNFRDMLLNTFSTTSSSPKDLEVIMKLGFLSPIQHLVFLLLAVYDTSFLCSYTVKNNKAFTIAKEIKLLNNTWSAVENLASKE